MLESLAIKNFRSCEDVSIRLDEPVIALVGKNGVGKTNLLHGLQLAVDLCTGGDSGYNLHPRDRSAPTQFELKFLIDDVRYEYQCVRSLPQGSGGELRETLLKNGEPLFKREGELLEVPNADLPGHIHIGIQIPTLVSILQLFPENAAARSRLRPVWDYLKAIRYYSLMQRVEEHTPEKFPFIEARKYEAWKTRLAIGDPGPSVLMRLVHMWMDDRESLAELQGLVGDNGIGLLSEIRVAEHKLQTPGRSEKSVDAYSVSFKPGTDLAGATRWFRFSGLSAGTRRILQILTYLIFDRTSCMLLEQPEDCIHPGLLGKLINILQTYSERTQLICTTHSPYVMNQVGAKGIRLVTAEDGRTSVHELSEKDLTAADNYLADQGTLAEFLEML